MVRPIPSTLKLTLGASMIAMAAGVAMPAQAQTAAPEIERCPDGRAPTPNNPCAAQTSGEAPAGEDIVVTGSRIVRNGADTVQPVQVISSHDIESRGFTTLGQALSEQPAFGVADSSPVGTQSSFGPGQSFVNFFGLGSQRTLVLVNGRRFVGSNTAAIFGPTGAGGDQVDLNLIPTKLIDRTETVAVGGAPIYGSDAIAGTINVILRHNYEGLDLDGQAGVSELGDGQDYRVRFLAGHNFMGGRLNLTFAGEYNEGKGLLYTDRDLSGQGRYYDTAQAGSAFTQQYYQDRRLPGISDTGTPLVGRFGYDLLGLNAVFAPRYQTLYGPYATAYGDAPVGTPFNLGVTNGTPTSDLKFDANGSLIPISFGTPTSITNSSGGNGYSLTELSNLLTNTRRYSGVLLGSFDFSSHLRLSGEAWLSHSEGTNLRDQPEYKSGFFDAPGAPAGDIILSVNNPFLTTAARAAIVNSINTNPLSDQNLGYVAAQNYFYLGRANTDLTTGRVRGQVDIQRYVLALNGDFTPFGDHVWRFEVAGNYGRSVTQSRIPTIIEQNFLNAAGAITDANPNGIPCLAGLPNSGAPTVSSTCSPLNLFGSGVSTQAARDYITGIAHPRSVNEQADFTANLTGALFRLPGGDFSFAVGYEHRNEHTKFNPSAIYRGAPDTDPLTDTNGDGDPTNDFTPYGQTVVMAPINASYNTDEVYGEINAPLIGPDQHIPLIHSLEFQGAVRYVNNSINGGAVTYTVGGRWAPIADFTFRGNFTRSIRSPSLTENSAPAQTFFGFADDPCDQTLITSGPNPAARAANCRAALSAAGLTPAQIASFDALSDDRSFTQAVAGDASLRNETANSFTIGGILQPQHILRGFTLSADYVDIKVKGVISSLDADAVLSNCYDSATYPSNPFCGRVLRDTSGQLSYIVTGYANQDELHYQGIIASADYRTRTPFLGAQSSIGLGLSYQHLFELSTTSQGTRTETAGDVGYSKDKGLLSLSYNNSGFETFVQLSYVGPAYQDVNFAANYRPFNREHGVLFTNLSMSYELNNRFQLRVSVDNLLNQEPPYPSSGTSDVYFRGLLGRFFRFGAAVHF